MANADQLQREACANGLACLSQRDLLIFIAQTLAANTGMTATQLLSAACVTKVSDLDYHKLLIVIAETVTTRVTPATIGFLIGWLRADQPGFVAPDGTQVGDPATIWRDQSGEGRDASLFGVFAKPSYETNEVNGMPVVRFDTLQEQLDFPELVFATDFTVALAGRTTVGADTLWLGHDTANHQLRRNRAGADNASFFAGGVELLSAAFAAPSSDFQLNVWRRIGGTVSFRQNKTARGTAGPDNNTAKFNTLCNNLFLGSGRGDIGEIAFWGGGHTDATLDALYDGWYKPRWGLP